MRWFHIFCVKDQDAQDKVNGVWNCVSCRVMPKAVETLVASVAALTETVDHLTKMVAGLEQENQALPQQLLTQPPPLLVHLYLD
jgi:hypothetical protein